MRKLWRGLSVLIVLVLSCLVIVPSQTPSNPSTALTTDPSPGPRLLVKTLAAVHPLPSGEAKTQLR